ncbi:hypothetical protein VNO77_04785 [Canavalia gladiata]|uniref:Uncharacterized protein n=1 Tax=Canavalia gladiata TaxID=3824 RepID=A0AAN9MZ54_CANGL
MVTCVSSMPMFPKFNSAIHLLQYHYPRLSYFLDNIVFGSWDSQWISSEILNPEQFGKNLQTSQSNAILAINALA